MSIKKEREMFNFFVSYYKVYKKLSSEQKVIFMDYILETQFDGRDLAEFNTGDDIMLELVMEAIKPNLQRSLVMHKGGVKGAGIANMDRAMQADMKAGKDMGGGLIDSFTAVYLASNTVLFDSLAKVFIDTGKDATDDANYTLYTEAFRDMMHNRQAPWNKSVQGINALFSRCLREKWIDVDKIDIKEWQG
jgi:hypothetical protein